MARCPGAGGNNEFLRSSKIISRQSSVSLSSRIYYRSSGAGFPFNWEMLPGEPKYKPANDEGIPPLSPPPAIQSLSMPKPSVEDYLENKMSSSPSKLLLKLWKKMRKKINKKAQKMALLGFHKGSAKAEQTRDISPSSDICRNGDHAKVGLDPFEDFGMGSSANSSCSPPSKARQSTSSCSLSPCSSSSSMVQDGHVDGADVGEGASNKRPFTLSRSVVVCAAGTKRVG